MTLTELKYVLAVAQEHHFGRAAESCSVSQPSLSVAVRKLEEELGVKIFERKSSDVTVTPIGKLIVERAQRVLEDAALLRVCAQQGKDPLSGELRLGTICTIAPYLIPDLVSSMHKVAANMPLILTEGLTANLLEQLKSGQLDAAIVSLPIDQPGIMIQPLYDEEFVAVVPANHPLAHRPAISRQDVKNEPATASAIRYLISVPIRSEATPTPKKASKAARCRQSATWSRRAWASRFSRQARCPSTITTP